MWRNPISFKSHRLLGAILTTVEVGASRGGRRALGDVVKAEDEGVDLRWEARRDLDGSTDPGVELAEDVDDEGEEPFAGEEEDSEVIADLPGERRE
jgi:hypothetical protein